MHRRITRFLPLLASALVTAAAVVACDRSSGRISAPGENLRAAAPAERPANGAGPPAVAPAPPPRSAMPSPESLTDTVITGKIKAAILSDPGMAGADVSVNTDHGVVILAGMVKSQEQAALASAHAQRQDGVMRVDNQLTAHPH